MRIPKLPDVYAWVCACGRHLPRQVIVCGECEERNPDAGP